MTDSNSFLSLSRSITILDAETNNPNDQTAANNKTDIKETETNNPDEETATNDKAHAKEAKTSDSDKFHEQMTKFNEWFEKKQHYGRFHLNCHYDMM